MKKKINEADERSFKKRQYIKIFIVMLINLGTQFIEHSWFSMKALSFFYFPGLGEEKEFVWKKTSLFLIPIIHLFFRVPT